MSALNVILKAPFRLTDQLAQMDGIQARPFTLSKQRDPQLLVGPPTSMLLVPIPVLVRRFTGLASSSEADPSHQPNLVSRAPNSDRMSSLGADIMWQVFVLVLLK